MRLTRLLAVLIVLFVAVCANAQLTILNIPSADVLDKGKAYVRMDHTYAPDSALYTYTPNLVFGIAPNTDFSVNAESLSHNGPGYQVAIVPGFKHRFFQKSNGKDTALTAYVGDKMYFPVHNKNYNVGNYLYLAGAVTIDTGTRLTAGVWDSQNAVGPGNRAGTMLGIEQNLGYGKDEEGKSYAKYVFALDWQSGHSANGAATVGIMYYPTPKIMIIPSYMVGNSTAGQGNHQAVLYIGYALN